MREPRQHRRSAIGLQPISLYAYRESFIPVAANDNNRSPRLRGMALTVFGVLAVALCGLAWQMSW